MPARRRPAPEDAVTARRILLDGMAQDTGVPELAAELAPLHPRDDTFPGEVLLQVAADALEWCGASRADPLALEGMLERFLPECAFRGRQNKKLQFAVLAAAALRGGAESDLLGAQRIDPVDALGILPGKPLPYWGWGDIPDQYRRQWDGDDGESVQPADPGLADLPPLRPHWGPASRQPGPRSTAL